MKKILTVATVGLVSATVVAPTFSAASSTADWSNDVLVGDTIYAESVWTDSGVFDGSTSFNSSEDADSINAILFSESDGIEFTVTQSGDVYAQEEESELYSATGETNVNTPVTDIKDVILVEGSKIDVEMDIVQTPTQTDLENLANLATNFGFTDDQLSSVLTDGETVTVTTMDGTDEIAQTTLSKNPIATTDETGTTDGNQEIAYTGLEK